MFRRVWKTELPDSRRRWGAAFFLLYLTVFPSLNLLLQGVLFGDAEPPMSQVNLVYYGILFTIALLIFWRELRSDLISLWDWLPENLMGLAVCLSVAMALHLLVSRVPFPVADPISAQYAHEFQLAPGPTLVLILVLIPLVEEILFRGFFYGQLRELSRPLAMVTVTVAYALAAVWRYAWEAGDPRYLALALLYLPMSAALTLCYENGGSVWATALLHGGINGFILWTAL